MKEADIIIIATPVWRGDQSSVAKIVGECFDGIMSETNDENGQYPGAFSQDLKAEPISTNLNELEKQVKAISDTDQK